MERTIDDRDPTIAYSIAPSGSTDWEGGIFGGPFEFNGTTTLSQRKGATATLTFSGTAVSVYGTISVNDTILPSSSYTLDGGSPVFYTPPRATGAALLQDAHRTLFFQAGGLERGTHTLVVTNEVDGDRYWLDYFMYVPTLFEPTSVSSGVGTSTRVAASTAGTATSTGIGAGDGDGSGSGLQTQTQDQDQGEKANNTAAIVGGVVGGAVLLVALIGAFLFWRRRNRRRQARQEQQRPAGSRDNLNDPGPGMVENGYHATPQPYRDYPNSQQPTTIMAQNPAAPRGPLHIANPSLDSSVAPFSPGSSATGGGGGASASDSGNTSGTGSVSQPSWTISNAYSGITTPGAGAPPPSKLLRDGYAPVQRRTSGTQPPAYQAVSGGSS
ncbi:unnamed protein product [Cyclocybe aegerita]|uniref:Uncharacterized protein n=1 Tax=Cyclocybe aegerita TaxID=1973307 RepID=A0A8S0VR92_CYCAE|nr:unnamed protein product [Cyclocybe aegerita]